MIKSIKEDLNVAEQHSSISVITVCYNVVATIEETILSVICQTYSNMEYIVIDGGSTDGTVDIIKKYSDKISYWISEPDKGIYDAMNKGIDKARRTWIQFLNAGDVFFNERVIEDVAKKISENHIVKDIVYGDIICKFNFGNLILKPSSLEDFKYYFPISHPATFVKKEILKKYSFNITYRISADYELFYRLFNDGKSFQYINMPIVIFDAMTGISSTNPILLYKENFRIHSYTSIIKYYIGIVFLRIRILCSFLINLLLPKAMKDKYLRARLLKNKRFFETNNNI